MKGLYGRLVGAYAMLLFILLTGLGIVLGQFFSFFTAEEEVAIQRSYILFLIIILAIAFILSLLMATKVLKVYAKPIDEMTQVATKMAQGEYIQSVPTFEPTYDDELSLAIKQISENMDEMSTVRGVEKERLKTLIESMGSGLLMFGRGGTVSLVNGVFRETFGFKTEDIIGKTINSIGLPVKIESLIEEVFMTEQGRETQVHVEVGNRSGTFSVYGAPVIGSHGNWLGIVVVIHDITKLVHLEEMRKDFVANVSHELRTPITSIKGFTETLLAGAMEEPVVMKEFLEIIQKESDRLHLLIDDLLELSGVERSGFKLEYTYVDLDKVIQDALNLVSGSIQEKKMHVYYERSDGFIVEGDEGRLIQVMVNLLSNAVTYSKNETTIKVSLEKINGSILIVIEDEGIGIDAEELPRLFERFYRVDRARSRDSGGTGLGLAIVKHLIEAHKGTVEVYSKLEVGTAFYVKLPIKQ